MIMNDLLQVMDGISIGCDRFLVMINDLSQAMHGTSSDSADRFLELISVVDRVRAASTFDFWADFRPTPAGGATSKSPFGPKGTGFDQWVVHLFRDAEFEGWHLTVSPGNRGNGTGTLVEFVDIARPHLPPGFVPRRPSLKRLQRLRSDYARVGQKPQSAS
jgi:hypothetical protein